MRIGANNIFQNTSFINSKRPFAAAQLNGTEASKTSRAKDGNVVQEKEKPKSIIENLMDQKQKVNEQKYSLIGKTLEKGGSLDSIETQLEAYDEQIKALDLQMATIMAEEMKKQAEKQTENKSEEPKTEEELQTAKMLSLISNSGNVEQAEVVQGAKGKLEGESKILESEIALDNTRPGGALESKIARLAEVDGNIATLEEDFTGKLANVNTNIVKDNEEIRETEKKEDTQGNADEAITAEAITAEAITEYPEVDVYA